MTSQTLESRPESVTALKRMIDVFSAVGEQGHRSREGLVEG